MTENTPLKIIIFGGTGDLVKKKIIPALFDLYRNGFLQENFEILGVSRKQISNEDFQSWVKVSLDDKKYSGEFVDKFIERCSYSSADISNKDTLYVLSENLNKNPGNNLYYLAITPSLYETAFTNIAECGFMNPSNGWDRVLVEKPFGNDLEHAKKLDELLGKLFKEEQVFRIDHYLAKETLQNILSFRFANSIFEPVWNDSCIEDVYIRMYESFDVDNRASFYDAVGALKDVGQNHILQMLALVAMEEPSSLDFKNIREARANVLEKISVSDEFIRGQYYGYKDIPGINPDTKTETYFSLKAKIDTPKWNRTNFYLSSGKALSETHTMINVIFKEKGEGVRNVITFEIQPKQQIKILFWHKEGGFDYKVGSKELVFDASENVRIPDAYEKVLFDAIKGDQTLFVSTREVLAQWSFIEKVIESWKNTPITRYEKGTEPDKIVHIQ